VRDWSKDLELYDGSPPATPHASPLEHVATPDATGTANFRGWQQLRTSCSKQTTATRALIEVVAHEAISRRAGGGRRRCLHAVLSL